MSELFQHILAPVDFTENNAAALRMAADLIRRGGGRLTLLHVIETIEQAGSGEDEGDELAEFYAQLEAKARERLADLAAPAVAAGVRVQQEILYGARVAEIVRYTAERDVGLVVMSSHKVDLSQPARHFVSLSHQVSILCQCPVLLVK